MIEFVVIFLVVLSCCGVLFIVLLFLPKAFPFVKDWVSRISSSYADWKQERRREAELEWEREKREAEELRRCEERLDRERRRRERNHLLWRWDFIGLLSSVGTGFGCWGMYHFLRGVMWSVANQAIRTEEDAEFVLFMASLLPVFKWIMLLLSRLFLLSFPCGLFFGVFFLLRFFSAKARYRRIVDREEGLKAERRRRQEGRQDD